MNAIEWYNGLAVKNQGYRSDAKYTLEGPSGETVFKEELRALLKQTHSVLDAGCGHGDFTLEMAPYTDHIVGFDFAIEMIRIAKHLKAKSHVINADFIYATTKEPLPFENGAFDLIYTRRGPTSIVDHPHLLKNNGLIFGIHSDGLPVSELRARLERNGFEDIEVREYKQASVCFPSKHDLALYLSASHMNKDYTLPENQEELNQIAAETELRLPQIRYIWKGRKGYEGGNTNEQKNLPGV